MNTMSSAPFLERLSVLGDETRARLLVLLERSEFTVTELCAVLQAPQPTVSRHLKMLASEGWVVARADGRNRHYRVSPTLDDAALALWRAVRDGLGDDGVYATDSERARAVLEERRIRSTAFFAETAQGWDAMREELFGSGTALAPLLGLVEPEWTVGDLGAGTGALAARLAPFARRVVAVDRSEEMLGTARIRLEEVDNVEIRQGELEALPIDDAEIDLAILALVLHYVVDPPAVLAEARRALVRGGRLLVVDMRPHDRDTLGAEAMGHVWSGFEAERMTAWLDDAGFAHSRVVALPPDPGATGPLLFLASARS